MGSYCKLLLAGLVCWPAAALLALRLFAMAESFVICVEDGPKKRRVWADQRSEIAIAETSLCCMRRMERVKWGALTRFCVSMASLTCKSFPLCITPVSPQLGAVAAVDTSAEAACGRAATPHRQKHLLFQVLCVCVCSIVSTEHLLVCVCVCSSAQAQGPFVTLEQNGRLPNKTRPQSKKTGSG